jgi:hypothetical protein
MRAKKSVCRRFTTYVREPGWLIGIAMGYGLDEQGLESRQGLGIFLFITASRPALGPTQLPYPVGIRGSFPGSKAAGALKLTTHLHLVPG